MVLLMYSIPSMERKLIRPRASSSRRKSDENRPRIQTQSDPIWATADSLKTAEILVSRREEISDLITAESGLSKRFPYEVGRAFDVFSLTGQLCILMTVRSFPVTWLYMGKNGKFSPSVNPCREDQRHHSLQSSAQIWCTKSHQALQRITAWSANYWENAFDGFTTGGRFVWGRNASGNVPGDYRVSAGYRWCDDHPSQYRPDNLYRKRFCREIHRRKAGYRRTVPNRRNAP